MTELNPTEVDGRLTALVKQRNAALDQVVVLAGLLAAKDAQIAALQEQLKKKELAEQQETNRVLPFSQEKLSEMRAQQ